MSLNHAFQITVFRGDETVTRLGVSPPREILMGRDVENGIRLESAEVSRCHARLVFEEHRAWIDDLSTNGVWVNGNRIQRSGDLSAGDKITVGPYMLRIEEALSSVTGVSDPAAWADLRRRLHRRLIAYLDLRRLDPARCEEGEVRRQVHQAMERLFRDEEAALPTGLDIDRLRRELADEALGLGPLEPLLADDRVTEIMVVDPETIFVEKAGLLTKTDTAFSDAESVRAVIERIVAPIGRRIDESSPLVDARLPDGSRVNAVIPPLAIKGPCLTIRRFGKRTLLLRDLVEVGTLDQRQALFLERSVLARKNLVISGGTGSGKTTLLRALAACIPGGERIVTIEDAAELNLAQPHVVALEARPANMEGRGATTIRDLVKNALRMRPDRIVVGECRGGEALDMLQAMNTGHDGSLTTLHANSPQEALGRLETMALMSGVDLPAETIRMQIASSVHVIVQIARFSDGGRRLKAVSEVVGLDDEGRVDLRDIFVFRQTGKRPDGGMEGRFEATGYLPTFLDKFFVLGLAAEDEPGL